VVNYFDEQRFSKNNVLIGKGIVRKRFKDAVELLSGYDAVEEHIRTIKNDYVGALKRIPFRLLRLFVHSYQSFLWNKVVNKYIKERYSDIKMVEYSLGELIFPLRMDEENRDIPIIGFDSDMEDYEEIVEEEGVKKEDFIIRQIPELSSEGGLRKLYFEAELKVLDSGDDELNEGKKKVKVQFELPKGSYATIFVKFLFGL